MTKYKLIPCDEDSNSSADPNVLNSAYVKFEEFYDEYEPETLCSACHGTGLDDDEFEDCPVCWGDGYVRQGGLTGRR